MTAHENKLDPEDDSGITPSSFTDRVGRGKDSTELRRMWKQYEKYTRKTLVHKELSRLLGDWQMEMELDLDGYGPNFCLQGTAVGRTLFEGRFIELSLDAHAESFPNYEAIFILGYDNVIDKTTCVMMENSQNGMVITEGTWSPESSAIVDWGEISNPMFRKRHDVSLRWHFVSDDEVTLCTSVPDFEGGMLPNMRIRFLRPGAVRADSQLGAEEECNDDTASHDFGTSELFESGDLPGFPEE